MFDYNTNTKGGIDGGMGAERITVETSEIFRKINVS